MVAVVTTELVIVLAYLLSLPIIGAHHQLVITILLAIALLFPLAFYHHSWSIWLAFDHFIEGLPHARTPRATRSATDEHGSTPI